MKRILFVVPFTIPVTELIGDNTGNYVYYLAVYSYLFGMKNVTCLGIDEIQQHLSKDKDYMKKNFDIAIMAEANLFAPCYKETALIDNANFIESLKIPCFVLGIGCQNDIRHTLKNLKCINGEVKRYVDIVLNSAGMLTLRGDLTAAYLKSLGYKNIPVLGCPSMYINGLAFQIPNKKVSLDAFKPMYNAQYVQDLDRRLYTDYPNSAFFDQDRYLKSLFEPLNAKNDDCLQNKLFIKLYEQGRILGDINYYPWKQKILDSGFNFSYGSRIHGNIIAIQSGIPAFVKVIDSRTREIAEFYDLPNSLQYPFDEKKDSLYDLYKTIDFSTFNKKYPERFNRFKNFLSQITGQSSTSNYLSENGQDFISYLSTKKYPQYDKNYQTTDEAKKLISYLKGQIHSKLPKISVIIACYNSADFVGKSIESVLNQTYQNWELLCVNDMSTDNTLEVLEKYAQKDSRIKVFDKKERGGRAAPNYNYAIDRSTGDFICLLDHDDTISPDLLEKEIERQQETNAEIIIPDCCFVYPKDKSKNWTMIGVLGEWGKTNEKPTRDILLTGRKAFELSLNWRILGFNLVKAEIMKKYRYCEESMNGDEYSARVFYLHAKKIAFSEGTYFYYQLDSSITKKMTPKRWDVFWTPYLLEKLLIKHNFAYELIQNMENTRISLYNSLKELYANSKKKLSLDDQKTVESLLQKNKELLSAFDISKLKPKKSIWKKLFSVKVKGDKEIIRILGVIKIKRKVKEI